MTSKAAMENNTDAGLTLVEVKMKHGIVTPDQWPPENIEPHSQVHLEVESSGFITDDDGIVHYTIDGPKVTRFGVWFDSPYAGGIQCKAWCEGPEEDKYTKAWTQVGQHMTATMDPK
ncbi:hypothetical protein BDV29DRAFT_152817 [Aspergillus leporis]|jgi:hypothetical protein|uniref:Aegerolysin type hemolysin n=1 Tax=Aspergillus leporis TaxID=41062 RepID=A0A5N5XBZ1_9EURO|nr:hypothetical protein BDV29DRAFT_152817 [Aspergillus leporis]